MCLNGGDMTVLSPLAVPNTAYSPGPYGAKMAPVRFYISFCSGHLWQENVVLPLEPATSGQCDVIKMAVDDFSHLNSATTIILVAIKPSIMSYII